MNNTASTTVMGCISPGSYKVKKRLTFQLAAFMLRVNPFSRNAI